MARYMHCTSPTDSRYNAFFHDGSLLLKVNNIHGPVVSHNLDASFLPI